MEIGARDLVEWAVVDDFSRLGLFIASIHLSPGYKSRACPQTGGFLNNSSFELVLECLTEDFSFLCRNLVRPALDWRVVPCVDIHWSSFSWLLKVFLPDAENICHA